MFHLNEIRKQTDGLTFHQELEVADTLTSRAPEILTLSPVTVTGQVRHERGLYLLDYTMSYELTLPSSRSLTPVLVTNSRAVSEVFISAADVASQQELVEEDLVLILEEDRIDLAESVVDNILLNLPIRVLTPEEEADDALPSGQSWTVLTESQYAAQKQADKEANSPFAGLAGLFGDD